MSDQTKSVNDAIISHRGFVHCCHVLFQVSFRPCVQVVLDFLLMAKVSLISCFMFYRADSDMLMLEHIT